MNRRRTSKGQQAGPISWLGQSVDTSSLCAQHPELSRMSFLTSLGCAIRKPSLRHTHFNENLRARLGVTGPLMIDSGGFALLMNPQAKWGVRSVTELIARIEAQVFVTLDFPPHPKDSAEERKKKIRRSNHNFRLLAEKFPSKTIMPVIHGRTLQEVEFSIRSVRKIVHSPKWIGLGGIVPLLQHRPVSREISRLGPEVFISMALRMIRESFPNTMIHAFGAGGTRTFPAVFAFGADSADSIGWRQAAGFGSIFLPLKSQRTVRWNTERRPPRKMLSDEDAELLRYCGCPVCRSATSLQEQITGFWASFEKRSIHNAWTTANQHRFWPSSRPALLNFVGDGNLGAHWARAVNASQK
jgi:queuine/archaeosine tRNA-ribosyltransferase